MVQSPLEARCQEITHWRQLRDAGLLADSNPGGKFGRPSAEQAEIARLTPELEIAWPGTHSSKTVAGRSLAHRGDLHVAVSAGTTAVHWVLQRGEGLLL